MNNQFPGPVIEANWGDWIEVKVTNNIPDEGAAIHWHGLLQKNTPYMDGVPGNTQCPIAPGKTFTYRFQAGVLEYQSRIEFIGLPLQIFTERLGTIRTGALSSRVV